MNIYVLINRNNVVVDILYGEVRYIKLQSGRSFVIGCSQEEGIGVIGSDCDTHYTLMSADTSNDVNAVQVIHVEELADDVEIGKSVYDRETQEFKPRYTLAEVQAAKQEENKLAFAAYLATHPLTWVDGKEYGVTEEDQSEISLNIN
jgi:hypothetical protein